MKLRHLLPALLLAALPLTAARAFDLSINIAPPVLPVYVQPPCPVDGYLWTPGYWGYGDAGYYWIPGVWCAPPRVGFLWTPGYWGYDDGFYAFHSGYWGPTVGFYGGVVYGYGYDGYGYRGGRWDGGHFRYNTYVTNVNRTVVRNTYIDKYAVQHGPHTRASFNGPGGVNARPDARQLAAARGPRLQPTSAQLARRDRATPRAAGSRVADNGRHARDRQPSAAPRANRDGLSPQERQLVNRRQARMDQRHAPEGYGFDRGAQRSRGYDNRAARYGGAESRGRTEKAERQQQKAERREGGDRKHDKRDER